MGSGSGKNLNLKLKIWRQKSNKSEGHLVDYDAPGVSEDASFLEMLDQVNEKLVLKGEEPVQYDASKIGLRGAVEEDKRRKKALQEAEETQRRNLLRMLEKIELKGTILARIVF